MCETVSVKKERDHLNCALYVLVRIDLPAIAAKLREATSLMILV